MKGTPKEIQNEYLGLVRLVKRPRRRWVCLLHGLPLKGTYTSQAAAVNAIRRIVHGRRKPEFLEGKEKEALLREFGIM